LLVSVIELVVELLEYIRRRFQPVPLLGQSRDLGSNARPVQLLKVAELLQPRQRIQPGFQVLALGLVAA
jgi:hypothetical protein